MCFVPDVLQHEQSLTAPLELDGLLPTGNEDLLETLCKSCNRNDVLQSKLVHDIDRDGKLALAAVDEDQLWWIGKPSSLRRCGFDRLVSLREICAQTSMQNLTHCRIVIVVDPRLDLEVSILTGSGKTILQDHHRADVVRSLQMGHVVALDA